MSNYKNIGNKNNFTIIPMSNLSTLKKFLPDELCYKIMSYASPVSVAKIEDIKLKLTTRYEINHNLKFLIKNKGKGYNGTRGYWKTNYVREMNDRLYDAFKSIRIFPNYFPETAGLTYGIIEDFCNHNNIKYLRTQTHNYQLRNLKNLYQTYFPNYL